MWRWDQGRIAYFQYDLLRAIAEFVILHDFRHSASDFIRNETGLGFPPQRYAPWRNYARVLKLCLLVSENHNQIVPTDVANLLARPGTVTCDEYLHFLAEATTDPSPALSNWNNQANIRHPLCFTLRYLLSRVAVLGRYETSIDQIIGVYIGSGFDGGEDENAFAELAQADNNYVQLALSLSQDQRRQSRESIKFLCQISYLYSTDSQVIVALSREDAEEIFRELTPVQGPHSSDGNAEIRRISALFRDGAVHDFFDYQATTISNELDSGFVEGNKVRKSHIVIERNSQLRNRYLTANPTALCDACLLDTHIKYPWTERVLDIHHLLPLSSGTRVDARLGTLLDDLIALCPTCHRAIHRFYDCYLRTEERVDFASRDEAVGVYRRAKDTIVMEN